MKTSPVLVLVFIAGLATCVSAEEMVIEEIVVTAQKRAESLQDVPVSVSALVSSDLEGLKLRESTDIAAQIPNLQASAVIGDGMPVFSLRGISMNDYSLNQNSPVATYLDEVYKGNPALQAVPLFDLERIEVLRGPQGTLYGKNSTGGAINFITQKPVFENEHYITVGAGNYSLQEADAAFNAALSDDFAIRLAGTWNEADGWLENKNPGFDDGNAVSEYGVRLSALWQPSDGLEVLLRLSHGKSDGVNYGIVARDEGAGGIGNGTYGLYNLLGLTALTDQTRAGLDHFEFESGQEEERLLETDSASLTINWDFGADFTLTSITSWDDGEAYNPEDADGSSIDLITAYYEAESDQISQDLRLTSDLSGPFNFIVGAYYANEEVENQTTLGFTQDLDLNGDGLLDFNDCLDPLFISLGAGPATPAGGALDTLLGGFGLSLGDLAGFGCQQRNSFEQERTSYAFYFDSNYALSDALTLRLGLRYTEDETELRKFGARFIGNDNIPLLATIPFDAVNPFATIPSRDFTDEEITGKIGLDYVFENGTMIYASYGHGYRTGAFNAQGFVDISEVTEVDPETLDSFEVGLKSRLWDGRLQVNAAAFSYNYEDQQFLDIDDSLAQRLINIDESEILGLEVELVARLTPNLQVQLGVGVLDTEVEEGVLSGQDLSGNEVPQAPELNVNFAFDWDAWTGDVGALILHVDGNYVDEQFYEVANEPSTLADSYFVANTRVTFESADARWAVSLWGKNLFEEEYETSILDLRAFFGYNYTHIGAPRTYGADVTFRF